MKSTINYIEDFGQTSRTILFERFTKENPDGTAAADLCMLLGGRSARDALLNEVEEKLGVRSFEEFVDKFTPTTIYLWLTPLTASKELPILLLKLLE